MSSSSKNPQIYVGGLGRKTRQEDVEKSFEKFGKIREVIFKNRYAFIVTILSL
jgi:RNA recognition motif-containing protein